MNKKLLSITALLLSTMMTACGGAAPMSSGASYSGASSYAEQATPAEPPASGEQYLAIDQNQDVDTQENSMLTFSLKVDTAAYSNVQRYIESGSLPPADAVRTEEMINYFGYEGALPDPGRDQPFALYTEVAPSPFDPNRQMAFIRVKTPTLKKEELPPSNLTFLLDTSGSMNSYDKLPLLQQAFGLLAETLGEEDRVSIVTYAGSAGVVLEGAAGSDTAKILRALGQLEAGGSTAGGQGIDMAYRLAQKNFIPGGNNRVILATDGDFNVGPSSNEELSRLIQEKRDGGIYLSILGFGTGNIRDDLMETLSKDGNGNYAYIHSLHTAQKVLVEELASSLFTVADDVKAQVEFNPALVASYRLVGYENRALANEDFENDQKDAGEIGVGTDVVALFELTLVGAEQTGGTGLKYQQSSQASSSQPIEGAYSDELFEVRIRYKDPGQTESKLVTKAVTIAEQRATGSSDLQFATAVAQFGELLRGSTARTADGASHIYTVAAQNLGRDEKGYRKDFLRLVEQYRKLAI